MKTNTVANATKNPALYSKTYWGAFRFNDNADAGAPKIIQNRDRFAAAFRLARGKYLTAYPPIPAGCVFDHAEEYVDANGETVVVCSNYGKAQPPPFLEMLEMAPIYSTSCKSYVARFSSIKELRAAMKGGRE